MPPNSPQLSSPSPSVIPDLIGDPGCLCLSSLSFAFVFCRASLVKARDMPYAANSPQLSSPSPSVIPDLIGDPGAFAFRLCLLQL